MIIDCISDLHGQYPQLEGGDLLIVAGDLTARDKPKDGNVNSIFKGIKFPMGAFIVTNEEGRLLIGKCDPIDKKVLEVTEVEFSSEEENSKGKE